MSHVQQLKKFFSDHQSYLWILALCFVFYIFDLGNLNAIRQGTEGFYLQISKEMFQQGSWLTPLYKGAPHWSKPPLHFWLAEINYHLFGPSLYAARLSTALTAFFGLLIMSHWVNRYFSFSRGLIFIALASTIGLYKYARIYMMEIPLSIFTVLSVLKYYDFLNLGRRRDISLAILFLALGILVKGPVALVMAMGGCSLFTAYLLWWHRGERPSRLIFSIILFGAISAFLAGLWFLACYQNYGNDFIQYFFLRENLGKFTAKSYPMSVLFKGLILYAFPVILLLPYTFSYLFKHRQQLLSRHPSRPQIAVLFLLFNFIPFFFLWFIPSQRSHHYALPALPLALLFILTTTGLYLQASSRKNHFCSYRCFLSVLLNILTLGLVVITWIAIFLFYQSQMAISILLIAGAILMTLAQISQLWSKSLLVQLASYFVIFSICWAAIAPQLSLPDISPSAVDLAEQKQVATTLRKFYFISEALNQEVKPIDATQIQETLSTGSLVVSEVADIPKNFDEYGQVLLSWQVWKRRLHFKEMIESYRQAGLVGLQETRVLLAPRK